MNAAALGSRATGNEPPRSDNYRGRDTTEGTRHAGTEYRPTDPPPGEVVIRIMLTFDRAATDFLGDCERRGFTPTSIRTYDRAYREFAEFIPRDTDVSKITTDDIRRYLNTKSRLAPGTRHLTESALSSLFTWLLTEGKIVRNPFMGIQRTRQLPPDDLDVVTVSTEDVQRMLTVAEGWSERLCMGILVFTGCRRRAASRLRLSDYDQLHRRLRFREKGTKTIWKPVPDELDNLLRAAIAAGVYADDDYLIPNLGPRPHTARQRERSHRVIYDIVKQVAAKAGVIAHTHAMRAAFIVHYLETHPGDQLGAQMLAGHRSPATTQIYQRKLDKQQEMERVRDLSWGVSMGGDDGEIGDAEGARRIVHEARRVASGDVSETGNAAVAESPQIAEKMFYEDRLVGAGGFEPPEAEDPLQQRPRTQPLTDALAERLEQAKSETADEARLAPDETAEEPV